MIDKNKKWIKAKKIKKSNKKQSNTKDSTRKEKNRKSQNRNKTKTKQAKKSKCLEFLKSDTFPFLSSFLLSFVNCLWSNVASRASQHQISSNTTSSNNNRNYSFFTTFSPETSHACFWNKKTSVTVKMYGSSSAITHPRGFPFSSSINHKNHQWKGSYHWERIAWPTSATKGKPSVFCCLRHRCGVELCDYLQLWEDRIADCQFTYVLLETVWSS